MEDNEVVDEVSSGQLPLRLYERLAQAAPRYTWDRSYAPFHTSYDHWHVYGLRQLPEPSPSLATPSSTTTGTSVRSSSSRSSPKLDPRPAFRHQVSSISETDSDISNARLDPEQLWIPVIARISTHVLRLEREYHHNQAIIAQWDPNARHSVRPVDLFRLPPTPGDSRNMAVAVYESPGPNYLREVIDMGPANSFGKRRKGSTSTSTEGCRAEQLPVQAWLDFAVGACECLELLHHAVKSVHGELRADTFHWNRDTGVVKLVNGGNGPRAFENLLSNDGWATMSREIGVRNRLSFMAPEQTGRLAAEPDSRTDIYSLGVLFWVLLTGKFAFEADSPLDIVSKVLTQRLPMVSSIRLDVPDVISHIVARMTMKQMDERYHSVNGLKYDLLQVQKMLGEGEQEKLNSYAVGQRDVSAFFILPSKTFGRSVERERIFKVIERVHQRQMATTDKSLAHALYANTSNSSISDARLDLVDLPDGSDGSSSSSHGVRNSRSNSTIVGPDSLPTSTSKLGVLGLPGKAIAEPRSNSLDLADHDSQGSSGLSTQHRDGQTTFSRHRNSHKFQRRGQCEVITLTGAQGVGKTHLIKCVQPHIRRHGYFALARFDRSKPTPFGPLLKVMGSLFRQIFSEKDVHTPYHDLIRGHVRPIWATLHAMLELPESLLDDQTPAMTRRPSTDAASTISGLTVTGLASSVHRSETDFLRGPASTKSIRLINTYLDVLRTMSAQKLICICLEDLHAADEESAELVANIITAKTPVVLLLSSRSGDDVPAYVQHLLDVDGTHRVELGNLKEKHVFEYVAATLFQDVDTVVPLAAVVHAKSGGNPFLMREILHTCYQKECLWYDWKTSGWQFDIDKVFTEFTSKEGCLDTSFVTRRLQELPPASRSILAWASLVGNTFSFHLILRLLAGEHLYSSQDDQSSDVSCPKRAVLFNLSESDVVDGLQKLLNMAVIVPGESDDEFRFAHTRYLRAANLMRECHNTTKMHAIIAFTMMDHLSQCRHNMYPLARHICIAAKIIKERVDVRIRYRDVLWRAAQTAATTGAKPTALWYYKVCVQLLQDDPWKANAKDVYYDETLQLYVAAAELHHLQGEQEEAMRLLDETFAHSRSAADRSRPWLLKGRIQTKRSDFEGALTALTTCLAELGVALPPTTWDECDIEFKQLEYRLRQIDRAELLSRPLSDDKTVIARGTVASEALSAAYWADSLLWYQLAVKMVTVQLDHGGTVQIGISFLQMAMVAISRFKDVELGLMFGALAQDFLTLYDDTWTRGRGWTMYALFVGHFQTPLSNHLPILESALDYSYSSGDRAIGILNIGAMAMYRLWSGQDLTELEAFCNYGPEEFEAWDHDLRGGTLLMAVRQLARALQGKTQTGFPETILDDDAFTSAGWVASTRKRGSDTQASTRAQDLYQAITMQVYYHYGYYREAADVGRRLIATTLDDLWTNRAVAGVRYYTALSLLALAREQPEEYDVLDETTSLKHFIDVWGSVDDVNYLAWSQILQAGIANLKQDYQTVGQSLEMAIDHAQVHGFQIEEATAIELQADFLLDRGAKRAGKVMVQEAIAAWSRINAVGKAQQLSDKHEWLLKTAITARTMDIGVQTDQVTSITTAGDSPEPRHDYTSSWEDPSTATAPQASQDVPGLGLDILDLTAILEFSRVISSELQIDSLLSKMTAVILESVGGQAEFCAVVIDSEDGWRVAASGDHEKGVQTYPDGIPFAEVDDQVAQHITTYLIRTRETIFVHNVLEDERFSNVSEAYLARNPHGRSIIAIPIILNDHLMGVIHLEGRPNVFTQRNMVVLNLLTNQVAISLGNALLYRKVRKVSASNASMVESQKRALAAARDAEVKAKKAEERALHSVKLQEEAAKAKSIFLANVSHELRTPLNGVIGMAELLKGTPLSKDQEGYADSIRVCADTLLTVINDILDFSKLEAGKMQLFTVPLNLKETITEVVRALAYTNQEHGLETIEDLQLDDTLVLGDPVRLHQVFMNLLSNSYKFTPQGSVTVTARKISETRDKLRITCSVVDTGIGITREQLTRLFQPFSQADSSTARSYGGSGLGLSICKAMIENVLGGKIWIESEPGVGTTVSFTLTFQKAPKDSKVPTPNDMASHISAKDPDPMASWSQASTTTSSPDSDSKACFGDLSQIPRSEMRVCVAEDNPINRKIAISFLSKLGLPQADAYEDGQLALAAIRQASRDGKPYHLVLMDVQMPNLDGYEATKLIRKDEDPNVRQVLVIAMTASAIRGDREKCLKAGMNDYLAKPVRLAALRGMLESYLGEENAGKTNVPKGIEGTSSTEKIAKNKENEMTKSSALATNGKERQKEMNGVVNATDIDPHTNGDIDPETHPDGESNDVPSGKRETDTLGRVSVDADQTSILRQQNGTAE